MKNVIYLLLFTIVELSAVAQIPSNGLVAYYPFNGNANDLSVNRNNGIINGATLTSDRHGIAQSAFSFSGADFIEIPSSQSLNPTDQLTIAIWVKVKNLTNSYTPVLHKGGAYKDGFTNREYCMYIEDQGKMYAESTGETDRGYTNTSVPTDDTWFFYVAVIDRVNHNLTIYLNGIEESQNPDVNNSFLNNNEPLKLASWDEKNSSYAEFFTGSLDDLRIYNRALSISEITALYNESADNTYYYNKGFEAGQAECIITSPTPQLKSVQISAYPNPTQNTVIINNNGTENAIDLSDQANGMYFLNVVDISGKTVKTIKVVKQ